jgi:hypothetical protein
MSVGGTVGQRISYQIYASWQVLSLGCVNLAMWEYPLLANDGYD